MAVRTSSFTPAPQTANGASASYSVVGGSYTPGHSGAAYSAAAPYAATPGVPPLPNGLSGGVQLPNFASGAAFEAPQLRAQTFAMPPHYGGANAPQAPGMPSQAGPALPTPEQIQKQKEGYIKLLDEQLKQGQATLDQQRKQQTEYLYQQAQQQKQQVEMQIKQQVQQQEMQLLQQYNQQLMQVQQSSSQQKVALEQQAMQLTMEYQQKKSQEEMMVKQQQLQREHVEAQMKFAQEMQKVQAMSAGGM